MGGMLIAVVTECVHLEAVPSSPRRGDSRHDGSIRYCCLVCQATSSHADCIVYCILCIVYFSSPPPPFPFLLPSPPSLSPLLLLFYSCSSPFSSSSLSAMLFPSPSDNIPNRLPMGTTWG
ncbi:uncharacterized protein LDX57_007629 [Aspergillus melleus]|uniref:uncharacterized protein n=1 Tax=Aspergillus melleus TaxID=138277 RepID=UPI001E8D5623|nr:uncharacterized protein LDX57_007629 [Aspergillus melleus]KAH8429957.1 hypothetical protein LDX57_007629 [Aspergillus melleus]